MSEHASSLKPICFMIMPFGVKPTHVTDGSGPNKIDFDALWHKALEPAIEQLGYMPVRADFDVGAMIITEMLERLALADLVIADVTIPNGNVYYEVGVRHAAKECGCILIAADWTKPLFDIAQMRRISYPMPSGELSEENASAIRQQLVETVPSFAAAKTPVYELPGFPEISFERASSFKHLLKAISSFRRDVKAAVAATSNQRKDKIRDLLTIYGAKNQQEPMLRAVALELLELSRDYLGWEDTAEYISGLSDRLKELPVIQEQYWLAKSKAGDPVEAIGALEELVATHGETPERYGLIAGRYKRLYRDVDNPADKARYLDKAIDNYRAGMLLDLNDYYCASNLPRLLRERGEPGDSYKAQSIAQLVVAACERAKKLGVADEWLNPTLLGAAFDAADLETAKTLLVQIKKEGASTWKLQSTMNDLKLSASQIEDGEVQNGMNSIIQDLDKV